jgi:hypothetical protein
MFRETNRDEWERPQRVGTGLLEDEDARESLAPEPGDPGGAAYTAGKFERRAGAIATRADARRKADDDDLDDDFDDEDDEFEDEEDDLEEDLDDDFDESDDLDEDVEEEAEEDDL